jgi:integrase
VPRQAPACRLSKRYLEWTKGRQASAEVKTYIIERLRERELPLSDNGGNAQTVKIGELSLRSFNTYLVEQLQSDLKRKGLRKPKADKSGKVIEAGPLKDTSCNRVLSTLKHMFSKAVEWDLVEETTLKKIRKVKLSREVGRLRYLSAKEAHELVSVCEPHLQPIVITALHTGMRRGEILNLRWDNVDLVHGFILLDRTKNGERREIPINNTLRETINRLPRNFVEKEGQKELAPYVFCDKDTLKPYGSVKHSFASAVKNAGIRDFHFHDLRHTFASLAMMSGKIDIATLSKLLGHKSLKMTMKYAHLAPAHMTKAAFVMDEVYSLPTDTKLTQSNEKGSVNNDQPFENLVELRGIEPLTPRLPALCSPS